MKSLQFLYLLLDSETRFFKFDAAGFHLRQVKDVIQNSQQRFA